MKSPQPTNFVPFDPGTDTDGTPPPAPGPRLKVVPKAEPETKADFDPLPDPSGATAAATSAASAAAAHRHAPRVSATPVVTLQREGDRVTGIRVECSCGQVIELACSY